MLDGLSLTPRQPDTQQHAAERAAACAGVQAECASLQSEVNDRQERLQAMQSQLDGPWQGLEPFGPPEKICGILCDFEEEQRLNSPAFDLTKLPLPFVENVVKQQTEAETRAAELETQALLSEERSAQAAASVETAEAEETEEIGFVALKERLESDPNWQSLSVAEKLQRLVDEPDVPEEFKARWAGLLQIHTIASRNEADSVIVSERLETVDLFNPPSAASFARAFIFDSPGAASGVSAETQAAIASELGISLHGVAPPRNASDLQRSLREGRGVERETEIRRVEEPPGSGNFVEREVVVSEKPIPFTEADPILINTDPLIEAFPVSPGSRTHIVKAHVSGGAPSKLRLDIPEHGSLPENDINNFVVSQQTQALLANRGYAGAINDLFGAGDSSLGISGEAVQPAFGQATPSRVLTQTLLGSDFAADGRFLSQGHLDQIDATCGRWPWMAILGRSTGWILPKPRPSCAPC